MGGFS
ncbi:dicB family protein, partial [Escherichia coli 96.0428]